MKAIKCSNSMADSTTEINLKKKKIWILQFLAGGTGSILFWGTKIPHIMQYSHKLKKQSRDPYPYISPFPDANALTISCVSFQNILMTNISFQDCFLGES